MRKFLLAFSAVAVAAASIPAHAAYLNGFGDVSVNYLHWSKGTQQRAPFQKNFTYLELEGGANYTWGELYGFADLNNPTKGTENFGTSLKGTIAVKTGLAQLRVYGQLFNTNSKGFTAQNNIFGLSYSFGGDGWYFSPYIGFNDAITSSGSKSFSGINGGAFGWVAGYNFNAFGQSFSVSNWNESEFDRKAAYIAVSKEANRVSANGALALWWNVTPHVTTGIQYRYSFAKLGTVGNQNAMIYTMKYNF